MQRTPRNLLQAASVVLVVVALSLACGAPVPEPEPAAEPGGSATSGDRYTVRGRVVELPGEDQVEARVRIRHEAIPDFKGMDGKVWEGGMESMTMSFALADGLSLDGIAAGDPVEFVLVVDWGGQPNQAITEIVELPPETELDFGAPAENTP